MLRIGQRSGNTSCHQTFNGTGTSCRRDLNLPVTVTRRANVKVRLTLNFFVLTSEAKVEGIQGAGPQIIIGYISYI